MHAPMGFTLVAPERPEEACEILASAAPGQVAVLAGGTDLLLDLDSGRSHPDRVLSLRRLPWRSLQWNGPTLTIGSTLPLSEIEVDPVVRARIPGLWDAIHGVGSLQLRHRATLGGNLGRASPTSDLIPMLLALDASVEIVGVQGIRSVPVDEFVLASRSTALRVGELIASISIPEARPSAYVWQRVRPSNDISQVGVAVARASRAPFWRVALGGVTPRPVRLPEAERELRAERPLTPEVVRAAEAAATHAPFATDKRATETYRRQLVGVLVRRAIAMVSAPLDRPVGWA
ncbi:MAG: FAD binding domain-containing protein [Thermoplasmata archaeon]|nr:FAD binding domain-containing protein [Thermoplasmata archaeon]